MRTAQALIYVGNVPRIIGIVLLIVIYSHEIVAENETGISCTGSEQPGHHLHGIPPLKYIRTWEVLR